MKKNTLIYSLFLLISICGCHKDSDYPVIEETKFEAEVVKEITGNILGIVQDEDGKVVSGALVQIYSSTTTTNNFGVFEFKNVRLDKNGTYLTVRKQGYFLGSDMVYPQNSTCNARVKMIKLQNPTEIMSTDGGLVNVDGGATIFFEKNSFTDGKSDYTGRVKVFSKLITPNNSKILDLMPGALIGDQLDKSTVVLGTAGMIAVELYGEKNEKLNLNKNKKAKISIPIINVPSVKTIKTWYFNESLGRWKEEGVATIENKHYVFEVSHFSFWNCDAPFPLINICGKVEYKDGKPASNTSIKVVVDGYISSGGITDINGEFCGKMPKDKKLEFFYINTCNEKIKIGEYGPFDNNAKLPTFIIEYKKNFTKIMASILCNNEKFNKSSVILLDVNGDLYPFNATEGFLNLNISNFICGENINNPISVLAYDPNTNNASERIEIKKYEDNDIKLDICKTGCNFTATLNYDCNIGLKPIVNGFGTYSYKWSNGSNDEILKIASDSIPTTYCVTITETNTNCQKIICKSVSGIKIDRVTEPCEKELIIRVTGGQPPYTYLWSDGSTEPKIINTVTSASQYKVTITDANGCTGVSNNLLITPTINFKPIITSCNNEFYSFDANNISGGAIFPNSGTQPVQFMSLDNLDKFKTGFNFKISIYNPGCQISFEVKLPQILNLDAQAIKPSCIGCKDGYIVPVLSTDCFECEVGEVKILDKMKKDVTTSNNNKELESGKYYIIVTDKKTGCYIGIKEISI